MKTYFIQTFGCQMNEHDSEIMAGMLEEMGYGAAENRKDADLVLVNTCSIRENANKHFFGTLGQLKKLKTEKPDRLIGVCGCMMQQKEVTETIKKKYPWVDIIFGTHNIHELPLLVNRAENERQKIMQVWDRAEGVVEGLPAKRLYAHKSYVNITYGCDNFCTYCIVPYTRGRERSRTPEAIEAEIRGLAADGVKEVMLLGQNVDSYKGVAEDGSVSDFADLLGRVNAIEGLERIRFMTSHPKDLSDKLIDVFKDCEKVCHCVHLPVQSGSDRVLKRMNRHYDRERYMSLVKKLREAVPDIAITTDIIVGFPGETEEDFEETLSLCREVGYDSAFTFMYSIRPGTPAAKYEDQIPEDVKHRRFDRLVDLINESAAAKNAAYVGRVEEVLVDGVSTSGGRKRSGTYGGRTGTFKLVNFPASDEYIGKIVRIEITSANTFSLMGRML